MKVIPNCFICRWAGLGKMTINAVVTDTDVAICMAQAFNFASACYNNEICEKLFEKKEEKMNG
jgi:hypothetical protein